LFLDYNEPRDDENDEDDNASEESIPYGQINVIAERHACPWIPKEQPQKYYDSELISFNTAEQDAATEASRAALSAAKQRLFLSLQSGDSLLVFTRFSNVVVGTLVG
jgi:hypothetical protein